MTINKIIAFINHYELTFGCTPDELILHPDDWNNAFGSVGHKYTVKGPNQGGGVMGVPVKLSSGVAKGSIEVSKAPSLASPPVPALTVTLPCECGAEKINSSAHSNWCPKNTCSN